MVSEHGVAAEPGSAGGGRMSVKWHRAPSVCVSPLPQICRHFQCVSASVLNYDCDVERQCHGHGVSRAGASAPADSPLTTSTGAVRFGPTGSISAWGPLPSLLRDLSFSAGDCANMQMDFFNQKSQFEPGTQ